MKMRLYLKGGSVIDVPATEFSFQRDPFGNVTSLDWKWSNDPEPSAVLKYVNLAEIQAIVRVNGNG